MSDKRIQLVQAALQLFHQQGIERTTLAHVAKASGVPLGNIYYYFKTKEELVIAVAESQRESVGEFLTELDRLPSPNRRLSRFVRNFDELREDRAARGCPWGSLCQEGNKLGGLIAQQTANVFQSMTDWIEGQFRELGCTPKHSKQNAVHILSVIQGASLAAHTFRDPKMLRDELNRLQTWLRTEFENSQGTSERNGTVTEQKIRSLQV